MNSFVIKSSLFFLLCLLLGSGCTQNVESVLKNTSQNTFDYINPSAENQLLFSLDKQQQFSQDYLQHYFFPWTDKPLILVTADVKQTEKEAIEQFRQGYWRENLHLISAEWITDIANNISMTTFPNHVQKAITVNTDNLRVLPTHEPAFVKKNDYPFDQLQEMQLAANTPVLVLQTSRDGAWDLVLTHSLAGWLPAQDVAAVDDQFIKQWQTNHYVVSVKDNSPINFDNHYFAFLDRIGMIHPSVDNHRILVAVADANRQAIIKMAVIDENNNVTFPWTPTLKNMATLLNRMKGTAYDWGGAYGFRDCSMTTQDLFAVFGVWLPRNSHEQVRMGKTFDFAGLSNLQRENIIRKNGVPFLSLIGLPGHIMLYIGERNGKLFVFHDTWHQVINATVITPLDLGGGYFNEKDSLIGRATGLAVLR